MAKNTDKKSFMLYLDSFEQWNILSDEQAGILIKAIFRFAETGEMIETDDGMVKMAFSFISSQIKRDTEKWLEVSGKRSNSGKMGGRPKKHDDSEESKKTNCFSEKANETKKAVTVTVTDTVTDTVTEKENIKEKDLADKSAVSERVSSSEIEKEFDELWNKYPRKEGRKKAFAAYRKARLRKEKPCSFEQVLKGIAEYSNRIRGSDPRYIKQGQTYFIGECWNDEFIMANDRPPDPAIEKYNCMINRF